GRPREANFNKPSIMEGGAAGDMRVNPWGDDGQSLEYIRRFFPDRLDNDSPLANSDADRLIPAMECVYFQRCRGQILLYRRAAAKLEIQPRHQRAGSGVLPRHDASRERCAEKRAE